MPKIHKLKILPTYFDAVKSGEKTFEYRYNDRDYNVDDTLILCEWEHDAYTGRRITVKVSYILKDFDELKKGWVVLAIKC